MAVVGPIVPSEVRSGYRDAAPEGGQVRRDRIFAEHRAGHFLGHPQTLALMESEYLYPQVADRTAPGVWEEAGNRDVGELAHARAKELLDGHYPDYIDPAVDARIRERFPIVLSREAMGPGCGRW